MENHKRHTTLILTILAAFVTLGCNDYDLEDGYDTGAIGGDTGYDIGPSPVHGPTHLQARDLLVDDKTPEGVERISPDAYDNVGAALAF